MTAADSGSAVIDGESLPLLPPVDGDEASGFADEPTGEEPVAIEPRRGRRAPTAPRARGAGAGGSRRRQAEAPAQPALGVTDFTLGDVETVRLILKGGSVIDWYRLNFQSLDEVKRFLRVNEFDLGRRSDEDRLVELRRQAAEYLARNLRYKIPAELLNGLSIPELLLAASQAKGRKQMYACILLKVMHIIHHLEARELLFRLPVSDEEVFHLVEGKLMRVIEELRAEGFAVVEFAWSRKRRDSHITKLLAKRETIAAQVFDKLRFRVVVKRPRDILPMLRALTERALPFNYTIPGQSVNELVDVGQLVRGLPQSGQLQHDIGIDERGAGANEFSGHAYRVINFIADLPIRIDGYIGNSHGNLIRELGPIVFVMAEFQLLDQGTEMQNRRGEASHLRYKERQRQRVKERLTKGMAGFGRKR
jgi:uncharacterized protein (TIGR04552 family)